jgi:hypothetical protein
MHLSSEKLTASIIRLRSPHFFLTASLNICQTTRVSFQQAISAASAVRTTNISCFKIHKVIILIWDLSSTGTWKSVRRHSFANVSEERTVHLFRFLVPAEECITFHQNACKLLQSHPRKQYSSSSKPWEAPFSHGPFRFTNSLSSNRISSVAHMNRSYQQVLLPSSCWPWARSTPLRESAVWGGERGKNFF